MKKLLPILFLFFVPKIYATDLNISFVAPVSFEEEVEVGTDFKFEIRVDNTLYLPAEFYELGINIFRDEQMLDTAYSETIFDEKLDAYTFRTLTFEKKFSSMEPAVYFGYAYVYYENDINRANDTIPFQITYIEVGTSPCVTEFEYLPGEGFRVEQNLSYFPDDKTLEGYMQRGDVIGLAAKVTDKDFIHHLCICNGDTTSTIRGPYSDNVYYEWTLNGDGKLLIPDDQSGTVFYEIPVCIMADFTATVNLKVKNGPLSMANDDEITGSFTINVYACPTRIYPEGMIPDWSSSCLRVTVSKENLSNGADAQHSTKEDAICIPQEIVFDKQTEITSANGITITEGEFCKPDYAVLLRADAVDFDSFKLKCQGEGECFSNDSVANSFVDPLKYEWSLVSGKGEFPLGTTGRSVVLHKSSSEGATLECSISNIDTKSGDNTKKLTITLEAAKKPKAFVGLGDDEALVTLGSLIWGWSYDDNAYYGSSSGFLSTAQSMKTSYEDAGYEVEFWEHVTGTDLKHAIQNPLYQAFAIVGHGSGGQMNMAGRDERIGTERFSSARLVTANQEAYQCDENPRIRDWQLIGCEALRGSWRDGLHCKARIHGWRTTKLVASLRYYAFFDFTPLPPVNLSLP